MSLQVQESNSILNMGLYKSKKGRSGLGRDYLPSISCLDVAKDLDIICGKMNTYKNISYILCPIMMDGKGLIMLMIMQELLLTHFGHIGK